MEIPSVLPPVFAPFTYLGLVYTSLVLASRVAPTRSTAVRLCSVYIAFCWISSMLFQVLISIAAFRPLPAFLSTTGLAACAWLRFGRTTPLRQRISLVRALRSVLTRRASPATTLTAYALATVATVALLRVMLLPLLGWDALTYHGLKAGLWAQTGRGITYDAPGGWEHYRYFFGGGESLTAWAMMPLGSDALAGLPDWTHWIALGIAAYALARQLRIPSTPAFLSTATLLTAPATLSYVGTGYVDTQQNACSLLGLLFLGRWSPGGKETGSLLMAGAALGLAFGTKTSAAPLAVALAIVALGRILLDQNRRSQALKGALPFALALILPSLYWCITNYSSYGYPLGVAPVALGPIRLGLPTPDLSSLLNRDVMATYSLQAQVGSLRLTLQPFGGFLLFTLAAPLILRRGMRRDLWSVTLLLLSVAMTLVFYFAPDFSVIRLVWARANARFLVTAVVPLALLGLYAAAARRRTSLIIGPVSCLATAAHMYVYFDRLLRTAPTAEKISIAGGVIALSAAALVVVRLGRRQFKPTVWGVACCMLAISVGLVPLQVARSRIRQPAYASTVLLNPFSRYWVPALAALDETPGEKRIAVTAGPKPLGHNWCVYPFMGANLENRITYVSPIAEGGPDFAVWIQRLREEGVTHVMSFRPASVELGWMEGEQENRFTPLAAAPRRWGLFRIEPTSPP